MYDSKPLFITGTARGGGNLVGQILSANDRINVASDPYLDLYRYLRNEMLRVANNEDLLFDDLDHMPFIDYYYSNKSIRVMEYLQSADADLSLAKADWEKLQTSLDNRATLQCKELRPHIKDIQSENYLDSIKKALATIPKARKLSDKEWIGVKESWIIEMFLPLAKAMPDAKFIVVLRDPRAVISSNLNVKNKDMVAHVLSFARSWRKVLAFAAHYKTNPIFDGRLYIYKHEDLVRNPEEKTRELCDFLQVDFQEKMLDTNNYINYETGEIWKGNSSYQDVITGINTNIVDIWKEKLDKDAIMAVELICGKDMQLIGSQPVYSAGYDDAFYHSAIRYLYKDMLGEKSWRTDSGVAEVDIGCELFRNSLLGIENIDMDKDSIKRNYLFVDVYNRLKENNIRPII